MKKITIPALGERYDEANNCFLPPTKEQPIALEHSLISLSKWEAKWHKPFLGHEPQTPEEFLDYVRFMTLTQNVDPDAYLALTPALLKEISAYINESQTATTFPEKKGPFNREIITAEIIYYWMVYYGIPFECQKWHLSRLLTLINVCNSKSTPPKKMSQREVMADNRALNAARRKKLKTRG